MKTALCRIALASILSSAIAPAATVRLGAHTFTLPDGYEIEVVAGQPLVDRPVSGAFDEQGRLYVTDSSGSNAKVEQQLEQRPHRVLRLEDTDGDGRFDRRTVFADRLMLPQGAMWRDGSLFVAAPPSIWKFTDTDGDGVADERTEWFQGKTLTGCANDLHGPYPGPAGFIYWCKGAFAEQTYERPGRTKIHDRASHIFRCRPDGSGLESVMSGGMDNPVDVDFTPEGEPIFTSTFLDLSGAGKRDGLGHAVYGGVFPKVNDVVESVTRTGDLLPAMTHFGPGAPCGLARLDSAGLGEELRGNFLACLFNLHKVTRHVLEPNGATFRTRDSDFVVSDNVDFHPTDVIEDADGSLLIIDTGGWYKLCCPTSQLAKPDVLGAIYRVKRKGAARVEDARGAAIEWSKLDADRLVALLADRRPVVAERATTELVRRGAGATAALAKGAAANHPAPARIRALWALAQLPGGPAREAVRLALADADASVRQTAIKIVGLHRDAPAQPQLAALLADDHASPPLRRAAAEALGRIEKPESVAPLLSAAARAGGDRFLEHSIIFALIEIADAKGTAPGLREDRPSATRRAALIALSEMPGDPLTPREVLPLLTSPDAALKQTALWVTGRHASWGGELAGFYRTRLELPTLAAAERTELEALLASMAREAMIQQVIAQVLRDGRPAAQATVLRAMARAQVKVTPEPWIDGLASALNSTDATVRLEAVTAATTLIAKKEAARLVAPLLAVAHDAGATEDLRLAALGALPAGAVAPEPALFALLIAQLDPAKAPATRSAAAAVLARARLDDAQRAALADLLPSLGPLELSRLLPAFDRALPEALARRFLAALQNAPAAGAAQAAALRTIFARLPAAVQGEATALLSRLNLDPAQQRARLAEIAAELPAGDIRRGQLVFNSAKAACTACHAMGYLGGKFGPDLTSIGQVRSERDLLEAVVFPSASFVRSYEPATVRLKSGAELTGIIRSETAEALTLALGPGVEQTVARTDIAELAPGTLSLMPQGLDQVLTRQELSDLVAFLKAAQRKSH